MSNLRQTWFLAAGRGVPARFSCAFWQAGMATPCRWWRRVFCHATRTPLHRAAVKRRAAPPYTARTTIAAAFASRRRRTFTSLPASARHQARRRARHVLRRQRPGVSTAEAAFQGRRDVPVLFLLLFCKGEAHRADGAGGAFAAAAQRRAACRPSVCARRCIAFCLYHRTDGGKEAAAVPSLRRLFAAARDSARKDLAASCL